MFTFQLFRPYDEVVTRWLEPDELAAWRAYIEGSELLQGRLERELQSECGLSHAEYEVLVRLSEVEDNAIRMTALAEQVVSSKSRLSHLIGRMERAGLVRRESCPTDRRGQLAVLTEAGRQRLLDAAPVHVRGVREHLVDLLTPEQLQRVGEAFRNVATHLHGRRAERLD